MASNLSPITACGLPEVDRSVTPREHTRGAHMQGREYALDGLRILVVEDEALIAMMLEDVLKQSGAIVLGPVGTAAEAVKLIEQSSLDCAILDYKLVDGSSLRVADALVKLDVPFLFASGCDASTIDSRYPNTPFLERLSTTRNCWRPFLHAPLMS